MLTEIQENVFSPAETDQITETKSTSAKSTTNKIKDPQKFAAGKKLAEKNKTAREALKKRKQREEEEEKETDSSSWLPNASFTTILSVVGIGLTIFDLYLRTRQNQSPRTLQSPMTENDIPGSKLQIKLKHKARNKVRHKAKGLEWSK